MDGIISICEALELDPGTDVSNICIFFSDSYDFITFHFKPPHFRLLCLFLMYGLVSTGARVGDGVEAAEWHQGQEEPQWGV